MKLLGLELEFVRVSRAPSCWRAIVDGGQWEQAARLAKANGAPLVSIWGTDRRAAAGSFQVSVAYATHEGLVWLALPLGAQQPEYPDLAWAFPCATRMQRAVFDLTGLRAQGAHDRRPWLRHGVWPDNYFPLRGDATGREVFDGRSEQDYPFVRVEGEGVHEIPVGPVHAGIIEPGHFRFSIVGEKVLRLEQRLGYTHKGIEKRFESTPALEGFRLAGRVSGDSTVAYAWAYCVALECAYEVAVPARARWLRALMLERERVANHLGDLGALGNDASLAFGLAQFSRLKEDWLRLNGALFGHRFMMDRIVPGGVTVDLDNATCRRIGDQCDSIAKEVQALRLIYDEHAGLQDRFLTTGRVSTGLAAQLGLCGLAGRASGLASDLRADFRPSPYDELEPRIVTHAEGDVAARVSVRFDELFESLRLIRSICERLPSGSIAEPVAVARAEAFGAGWVEGWRGPVFVALELGEHGSIRRCHCHDPSWQNWPVLEHAIIGNIVPDFPLINKSFNLSYSGQDL
jgi:Ni,Fe-hydrogenase III large subunit/Ni,Fe-hydrogenase III component G